MQPAEVLYKMVFIKTLQYLQEKPVLESLFNKVESLQILRRSILKTSANDCLVHNMSLKA